MLGQYGPAKTYSEAASGQRRIAPEPPAAREQPAVPEKLAAPEQLDAPEQPAAPEPPVTATKAAARPPARRNHHNRGENAQPTRQQPTRARRPVYDVDNPNSEWTK